MDRFTVFGLVTWLQGTEVRSYTDYTGTVIPSPIQYQHLNLSNPHAAEHAQTVQHSQGAAEPSPTEKNKYGMYTRKIQTKKQTY